MPEAVRLLIDGRAVEVPAGTSLLAALWNAGVQTTRTSVTGEGRGALCGMGTCHECRVTVDGSPHQRSCLVVVQEGMKVETGG